LQDETEDKGVNMVKEISKKLIASFIGTMALVVCASTAGFAQYNGRNDSNRQDMRQDRAESGQLEQQLRNDEQQLRRDQNSRAGRNIIRADKQRVKQDKKRVQRAKKDIKRDQHGYR